MSAQKYTHKQRNVVNTGICNECKIKTAQIVIQDVFVHCQLSLTVASKKRQFRLRRE